MKYTEDERALIWLHACTEFDPREKIALLRAAPSPSALFSHPERYLSALGKEEVAEGLSMRSERLERFLAELEESGYFAVTVESCDYPEALKIASPPLVMFGAGRRELLKERKFCIVGSRITPSWAAALGSRIAERLSRDFAVVTGLAEGGDCAAIRGALMSGKLICVLPNGLDTCYPAAHAALKEEVRRVGLLLSEYLPGETAKKYSFHARNRILAGLAEGTLVISAGERSGALITAYDAVDFGRDVFAFPYNPGTAQGGGCNELLKRGAYVCTGIQDILEVYHLKEETDVRQPLTEEETRAYEVLQAEGELHAAVIADRAGIPVYQMAAILASLELKGYVVKAGGNRYSCV